MPSRVSSINNSFTDIKALITRFYLSCFVQSNGIFVAVDKQNVSSEISHSCFIR